MNDKTESQLKKEGFVVVKFDLDQLKHRQLLSFVVLNPKLAIAILMRRRYWLPTVLTTLALLITGSFLGAMFATPEYGKDMRQVTSYIVHTVGPVKLQNGTLNWQLPAQTKLPVTAQFQHTRLDIAESVDEVMARIQAGKADNGVVVTPKAIRVWKRYSADAPVQAADLGPEHLQKFEESFKRYGQELVLTEDNQSDFCRLSFIAVFVYQAMSYFHEFLTTYVMSVWILTMAFLFLIRMGPAGKLISSAAAVACNITLPPLFVAMLYKLVGIDIAFSTVFLAAFVLYAIYGFLEGRNGHLASP